MNANIFKLALSLIKTVEQTMPDSAGKEKFDLVVSMLSELVDTASLNIPALVTFATGVVNFLRAVGIFKAKAA